MSILTSIKKKDKGQVLVIFAVALFALLVLVGLAIDGTQLFLNYTRLKRAVDSASVAAANDFRKGVSVDQMKESAIEVLSMQQVTDTVDVEVYTCDMLDADPSLQAKVPGFYRQCPKPGQLKKKLIYVEAFENSPTNFLTLIGLNSIPITTNSVSEAAPVDLVIVLDTSESMGGMTPGYSADFNPASCNADNNCQPLETAKSDAKQLVDGLYPGYDQVAIVTFDAVAQVIFPLGDPAAASNILANNDPSHKVLLHDDPYVGKLFPAFKLPDASRLNAGFNPINPEDPNNDGSDIDTTTDPTRLNIPCDITDPNGDRWDAVRLIPCDDPEKMDAFNWITSDTPGVTTFTSGTGAGYACTPADSDTCASQRWMVDHNENDPTTGLPYDPPLPITVVSTCTGCGVRVAANQLVQSGRTNAVWVMVFLSDGVVNKSDTSQTFPYDATTKIGVKSIYPNGYCGGRVVINNVPAPDPKYPNYWLNYCQDDTGVRHCINANPATCPPGSVPLAAGGSGYSEAAYPYFEPYSVLDYAKDQTDAAALRSSSNPNEKPTGNDIAIYSIMFKSSPTIDLAPKGAPLLRYMAAVGDDGNRDTDPCAPYEPGGITPNPKKSCGQFYYADDANALLLAFRDIASRIYTKISE